MSSQQSNRILLYNGDHNTNIENDVDRKYTPLRPSRSRKSVNTGGQDFEFTQSPGSLLNIELSAVHAKDR